jgi:fatty acid desaturase
VVAATRPAPPLAPVAARADRISADARQISFSRAFLAALAGVFYAIGWTFSKVTLSVAWVCAAIRLGWTEARQMPGDRESSTG